MLSANLFFFTQPQETFEEWYQAQQNTPFEEKEEPFFVEFQQQSVSYGSVIDTSYQDSLYWKEQHLYGSSRLGIAKPELEVTNHTPSSASSLTTNFRNYELTNHLGNILATIKDEKQQIDQNNDGIVDYYEPIVITANDYYPFGMVMPNRNFSLGGSKYRFGFGGHEKDNEIKGSGNHLSFGDYGYDARLGRRWQLDPVPQIGISDFSAFNDNPILYSDPDGKFPIIPIIAVAYYAASKIMEKSEGNEDIRAIGYSMRHPINAFKVNGPFITNHNDIATNFQVNIGKAIGQPRNPDGGAQNAIRHTLWQAIATRDLGAKAASRVGNAHEKTTNVDLNQRHFGSLEDADRTIDLLNNKIGRSIGEQNKDADNTTIAKSVVGEYYKNGLWTASGNAKDGYTIQKTKLTKDQYNSAIKEIDKKGQDGLNKKTDE